MPENQTTISVVIPAYNQANFLKEAIESVLSQTFHNFEIIVVDDGSTDDTPAVAQQYGNAISYIRQENQGLAGARNTGILHANGKYIALLDSDDQWLPSFLQTMMSLATQNPDATLFYGGWRYIDFEGRVLPQKPQTKVVPPHEIYWTLLRANFLIPSGVVIKRSPVLEAGLFDRAFRRLQDWEFWLRLLQAGHIFVGSDACLVHYRLHDSALSVDSAGGQKAVTALAIKHFGIDDGKPQNWSKEKRRVYGGVYRYHLLTSAQCQIDWCKVGNYMQQALMVDPTLAVDLDLFYDLALGSQPPGYRGTPTHLNFAENAKQIESSLEELFMSSEFSEVHRLRRTVLGSASFALGLAAYNTGNLSFSRHFLLRALYYRPDLWRDTRVLGNLLKSILNQSLLSRLKKYRRLVRTQMGSKAGTR